MKDISVGQRGQAWDRGDGCGMVAAVVGQRGEVQDGGGCHGMEETGMAWRGPS